MSRRTAKDQEDAMKNNLTQIRIYVDREADARLSKLAQNQHRTKQRQVGLILELVARLYQDCPQKLVEMGLLTPMTQ